MKTLIIAEAGVNHNGQLSLAKRLVLEAKKCGADVVKFQTFKAESIISKHAEKAAYQKQRTDAAESQFDMLKKLELSQSEFMGLREYCRETGIVFLSTPFDLDSIDFLESMDMPYWKVPSGEITNLPYLIRIASTKKPVLLSTGMSTNGEIRDAMTILKKYGAGEITLLHCTTEYPAPIEDVNLRAIISMQQMFGVKVGYSDHSVGIHVPIAAVALGATAIEKHFTLDKNMDGPDHRASMEPDELCAMISSIRDLEAALGDGIKRPMPSEIPNIAVARKSIVAKRKINKGEPFTEENITVKRPGTGISPMQWFEVLGKTAVKDFHEDEMIRI